MFDRHQAGCSLYCVQILGWLNSAERRIHYHGEGLQGLQEYVWTHGGIHTDQLSQESVDEHRYGISRSALAKSALAKAASAKTAVRQM